MNTWPHVTDLRDFYDAPCGRATQLVLGDHIRAIWPDLRREHRFAILGYGPPYALPPQGADIPPPLCLMPAAQGALVWPHDAPRRTCLVREDQLPLPDRSVDRLLMIHCLEATPHPQRTLREIWRVLADDGRLLVIVPSRAGLWSRVDTSPFATGRPYSSTQLTSLLRDCLFTPGPMRRGLYMPPGKCSATGGLRSVRTAPVWERIGARIWPRLGGVLILEAIKQLAAPVGPIAVEDRAPRRRFAPVSSVETPSAGTQASGPQASGRRKTNTAC